MTDTSKKLAALIVIVSVALIPAPAAYADPGIFTPDEAQYLEHLAQMGILPSTLGLTNGRDEVGLGQGICLALNDHSINDIARGSSAIGRTSPRFSTMRSSGSPLLTSVSTTPESSHDARDRHMHCAVALAAGRSGRTDRGRTGDDAYFNELTTYGFNVTPDNSHTLLVAGHAICTDLEKGDTAADESATVYTTPKITEKQAGNLVTVAQLTLCPDTVR